MKIAVCDNSKIIINSVTSLIEDYIEFKKVDLKYETFESYEALVDKIDDFDLFILDYNMNDDSISPSESDLMNGLDFAKLVRAKSDPHKGIIFLTSYNDIVYESFEVRAYRFLVKPLDKSKLFKALDDYFESIIETGTIFVKFNNEVHIIDIDSIYYFEVMRKDIYIHLENKTIRCHKKIEAFEQELLPFGFYRTHRSFLVNVSKIETISSKIAKMKNGDEVFVSSKKYSELCEKFLDVK